MLLGERDSRAGAQCNTNKEQTRSVNYYDAYQQQAIRLCTLPAPIAPAALSDKRPPNRMVSSRSLAVWRELRVLLAFLLEASISWSGTPQPPGLSTLTKGEP
jgi:hypothetical protein